MSSSGTSASGLGRPSRGPLAGVRVLDSTGLGPGPYCAMLLGDLGADVVRIERPGSSRFQEPEKFIPHRSRRSIVINLTAIPGRDLVLRLLDSADVFIEGNRPGVMERLGLGPDVCLSRNPRLVYARMTGWGQDGPLANEPGHDVNYLSIIGALSLFRRSGEKPMFRSTSPPTTAEAGPSWPSASPQPSSSEPAPGSVRSSTAPWWTVWQGSCPYP